MQKLSILVIADAPIIQHSCSIVAGQLSKQWVRQGHTVNYLGYGLHIPEPIDYKEGYKIYPDTVPLTQKQSVLNCINKIGRVDIIYLHGSLKTSLVELVKNIYYISCICFYL